MTQLIIESTPPGAEVTIGGQTIGTTPMAYTIDEPVGLAEFRAECLSGGNVACSWYVMETRLNDQTVSGLWWDLTRDERYSIAEMAVKNTLFYNINFFSQGLPLCQGSNDVWGSSMCGIDSMIRYLKFTGGPTIGGDSCYWKRYTGSPTYCYLPDKSYNLPGAIVSCVTYGPGYGHSMAAIQIGEDVNIIDNWVIFQYNSFDIKPGDSQLPVYDWDNIFIKMLRLEEVLPSCGGSDGVEIVRWDFL